MPDTALREQWRNRVVRREEHVDPNTLTLNPKNWRKHPEEQANAMDDILNEVGWVTDVIVNETTGHVLDGELRVRRARNKNEAVPVTYVSLTPEEEEKVLATFDLVTGLAQMDTSKMEDLMANMETDGIWLRDMIERELRHAEETDAKNDADEAAAGSTPSGEDLALQPFEHHDYIVLLFNSTLEFDRACALLGIEQKATPMNASRYKIGLGRVVNGQKALEILCKPSS